MHIKPKYIQRFQDNLMFFLGVYVGITLAALENFEVFKLFNIIGITFDIFGVLILSYVIVASQKIKEFVSGWGAAMVISIIGFLPIGLFMGGVIASEYLGYPKVDKLFSYYLPITIYSMLSVFFIEDTVLIPKLKILKDPELRVKVLGGFLLLSGLGIQLYAAVLDLLGE